jgi:hypothetical protein
MLNEELKMLKALQKIAVEQTDWGSHYFFGLMLFTDTKPLVPFLSEAASWDLGDKKVSSNSR